MTHTDNADGKTVCGGCICKAVPLLKRVESGESVEIRKRNGEWPEIHMVYATGEWSLRDIHCRMWAADKTFAKAAAAWNGGAA